MTGLIDVGGGMRDIYGAGVTDFFLDNSVSFDLCIGVSAGSANLASFLAGHRGRTYRFYADYSSRSEYMSFKNMFRDGSYFNLDYIYGDLSNSYGEDPLNFEKLMQSPSELITVVTNAKTGKAEYFSKNEMKTDNLWAIKASCAMPVACKPFVYNSTEYYDGGISDPLPVKKAFEMGCDKVFVIVPRPLAEKKREFSYLMKPFLKNHPNSLELMRKRPEIYNGKIQLINDYIEQGKVVLISPEEDKGLNMLTRDKEKLTRHYEKGYNDAMKAINSSY